MKKETKNRNQKKEKKRGTFSPGLCFQPGLKVLPRGGPWPGLEAPFTSGWCFQLGLKVCTTGNRPVAKSQHLCRESALGNGRPSAKPYLPKARPSAKNSSRQPGPLPRVRPSAKKGHRQPVTAGKRPSLPYVLPRVRIWPSAKNYFAECRFCALGKKNFFAFFASKFFPWVYCCTLKNILKFGAFFILLAIFNKFISFT